MKRVGKILVSSLTVLSILFCLTAAMLWVRGRNRSEFFCAACPFVHDWKFRVGSCDGTLLIESTWTGNFATGHQVYSFDDPTMQSRFGQYMGTAPVDFGKIAFSPYSLFNWYIVGDAYVLIVLNLAFLWTVHAVLLPILKSRWYRKMLGLIGRRGTQLDFALWVFDLPFYHTLWMILTVFAVVSLAVCLLLTCQSFFGPPVPYPENMRAPFVLREILTVYAGVFPIGWLFVCFHLAKMRKQIRVKKGDCEKCGYDLRATPDRCPECGTVPKAEKS